MYAYNAWYVAAWGREIGREPLGRKLLDEPIVFYRDGNGRVVALEDRCCHRGMPLSKGDVVGDQIRCGYHGLVFNAAGRCVEIPGQSNVPAAARVRSFPVEELDEIVWIWVGDPELADSSQIVRYPWHARWPHKSKTERLSCNYALMSDNLLDQSHAAYVHKTTLASDPEAYVKVEMKTAATPTGVKFTRWMRNCVAPGIYSRAVSFKGRVDRWQEFEYVAPSCILQFTGAADVGGDEDPRKRPGGFGLRIFYGMTPETEHTMWFLWSVANGHRHDDPQATEDLFREMEAAFKEDELVLVAQDEGLRELGQRPLMNIVSDGARVQARRALDRLIDLEKTAPRH